MLDMVTATRFYREMTSGRTNPSLLSCLDRTDDDVEVIAKFSGGCDRGVDSLVTEAIAALLGIDLGLPVPEPFLVEVDQDFIDIITNELIKQQISGSVFVGFGSKKLPQGFYSWGASQKIPVDLLPLTAEIIAFDGLIQNPDRRPENTNCLSNGIDLAIFDHDLAFVTEGILFWKPPWESGGLDNLINAQNHIFFKQLKRKAINFDRLREAWSSVTDARLQEYENTLPAEWLGDGSTSVRILDYIRNVRDNIDEALLEVERLLL